MRIYLFFLCLTYHLKPILGSRNLTEDSKSLPVFFFERRNNRLSSCYHCTYWKHCLPKEAGIRCHVLCLLTSLIHTIKIKQSFPVKLWERDHSFRKFRNETSYPSSHPFRCQGDSVGLQKCIHSAGNDFRLKLWYNSICYSFSSFTFKN